MGPDRQWTNERVVSLWSDLANLHSERPTKLLRRRFRQQIDPNDLAGNIADDIASVFLFWGVLEVEEAWTLASCEREEGLKRALTIFLDATKLAEEGNVRRRARFNCGLVELLRALVPDQSQSLLLSAGVLNATSIPHLPTSDPRMDVLVDAYRYFEASNNEDAKFDIDMQLVPVLLACGAWGRPVRKRLEWLRKCSGGGPIGELAASERERLSGLSFWTRVFGRTGRSPALGTILPIYLPLAMFELPDHALLVLDVWAKR